MTMIRPFRDSDAPTLAEMFRLAIRATTPEFYSDEQSTIWASRMPDAAQLIARCKDGRHAFVACDAQDQPVAFVDLEPDGHLDFMYCHPDHTRKGYASALCDQLEKCANSLTLNQIYVEVSEAAYPFFQHKGYTTTKRRVFDMDGVTMHNYAMRKGLTDV